MIVILRKIKELEKENLKEKVEDLKNTVSEKANEFASEAKEKAETFAGKTLDAAEKLLNDVFKKNKPEDAEYEDIEEVEVPTQSGGDKPSPRTQPKSAPVVASATRSTASKRIVLKASQVALAKKLGLTPEQYARELMKMER